MTGRRVMRGFGPVAVIADPADTEEVVLASLRAGLENTAAWGEQPSFGDAGEPGEPGKPGARARRAGTRGFLLPLMGALLAAAMALAAASEWHVVRLRKDVRAARLHLMTVAERLENQSHRHTGLLDAQQVAQRVAVSRALEEARTQSAAENQQLRGEQAAAAATSRELTATRSQAELAAAALQAQHLAARAETED